MYIYTFCAFVVYIYIEYDLNYIVFIYIYISVICGLITHHHEYIGSIHST